MKISVNEIEFCLNNCSETFPVRFQEEIDQIFVNANLCDYEIEYNYSIFSKTLHCYFYKKYKHGFTFSLYHNEKKEFDKYSIYFYDKKKYEYIKIYRKRNSTTFFKILKNLRKML